MIDICPPKEGAYGATSSVSDIPPVSESLSDSTPLPPETDISPMTESVIALSPIVLPKKLCSNQSQPSLTVASQKQPTEDNPNSIAAIERGDWLDDTHIQSVNRILRHQFPTVCGLQNPLLGQTLTFERINKPYVQIIHTNSNHWLAVQGVHGSFVKIYDSRYRSMSTETRNQIANLTLPSEKAINVHIQNVQYQIGTSDCGLYAIAFVTEMCYGNNPSCYR